MSEKVDAIIAGINATNQAIAEQEKWAQIHNGDAYINSEGLNTLEEIYGAQTVADANYLPTD